MNHIIRNLVIAASIALVLPSQAFASGGIEVPTQEWEYQNIRSDWDKAAIMRGYQVATEVCLNCHSFKYINHRDMMDIGFTEAEVKALASNLDMNIDQAMLSGLTDADAKEMYTKALPDLSLINKSRANGANYVYALLTGYTNDKHVCKDVSEDLSCNKYFPGHAIAMPSPFVDGQVDFFDETEASVQQMSKDVVTFLAWAAEPEKKDRERTGVYVLIYLFIMSGLFYIMKKKTWKDIKKKKK